MWMGHGAYSADQYKKTDRVSRQLAEGGRRCSISLNAPSPGGHPAAQDGRS